MQTRRKLVFPGMGEGWVGGGLGDAGGGGGGRVAGTATRT